MQAHDSLEQQLHEVQRERDELRGRLDNVEQTVSAAENARDESVARIAELEQSLRGRDDLVQEDAERRSQLLQQINAVIAAAVHSDRFETDSEPDVVERVRCLVRTSQDKTSVCCFFHN